MRHGRVPTRRQQYAGPTCCDIPQLWCVFSRVVLLLVLATMALPVRGAAQSQDGASTGGLPEYVDASTHHELLLGQQRLAYTATAGTLPVPAGAHAPQARIFYVSYVLEGTDPAQRPLTFVLNGGPGAAAVYLHLGTLGPRRLVFNQDGTLPPPPAQLADNPFTWLPLTDLVFVDPVGTGFSRSTKSEANKNPDNAFWNVQEDLQAFGAFMRLYLTRNQRWQSEKFLVGESYGGFRAALLAAWLPAQARIPLNGVVLISPALEFSLLYDDPYRLLPWVLRLPSYAAVAWRHGKSALQQSPGMAFHTARETVERRTLTEVLPGLAQGDTLEERQAQALYASMAEMIGIPDKYLKQYHGKIPARVFIKTLLQDTERLVSLYDGSLTAPDPAPGEQAHAGADRGLESITVALYTAFQHYVRDVLRFTTEVPYYALNPQVSRAWNWRSGINAPQGFAGAAASLQRALNQYPALKVWIAHGYYDLVTPYFCSVFVVNHLRLEAAARQHLNVQVYEGGHMFYTHAAAHEHFARDARTFYHKK